MMVVGMGTNKRRIEIELPEPHPNQKRALAHQGSAVIFAGRRFGKTQMAVYRILICVTLLPGLYWWVGISWRSASMKRAWRLLKYYVRKMWHALGKKADKYIREAEKELIVPGGGAIWLRTAERPDSLAGEGIRGAVVDEFSLMEELIWTEYLQAALLDYDGWVWFIGVPKGMNWAARLWMSANDRRNWRRFKFTTYDNPYMRPELIDEIKTNTSERIFQQEHLAEILPDGGAVFRGVSAVMTAPMDAHPMWKRRYVAGLDWGKDFDYTAIVVFDVETHQMVDMDRFNQIGWALQRGRVKAMYEKWQLQVIVAELNSIGSPNIEALQAEGIPVQPFTTTSKSKQPLIEALALAIERADVALQPDEVLQNELNAYTVERLPGGGYRYGAPSGYHDDTVMAAALGWHAVSAPLLEFGSDFFDYRGG